MSVKRAFAMVLAAALVGGPLLAHGKGKLKLESQRLVPGGQVEMTGTEFAKSETFSVLLVGAAGRTTLGKVKADSAGRFAASFALPGDLAPGSYRIAVEASDKDLVASADVQIEAGASLAAAGHTHAEGEEHGDEGHADEVAPSTERLELDRARSPAVTGSALAGIVAALALGVMLLRRNGGA